ncbi:MAG TPA: hypothetical protein VKY31_01160 [Terriglobia bacterium]|jgi:hypothetical protein|nr:hypothetical protein [Terriglobia bacterium]
MPAAAASVPFSPRTGVARRRVSRIEADTLSATCWFSIQDSLSLSRFIGGFVRAGDEIEFHPTAPLPLKECRLIQQRAQRHKELYFGSIGYAAQPKADKRGEYYVRAEVPESRLGPTQIHLRNEAVRDYFYFANRRRPGCEEETLYDLLGTAHSASPTDLRLAWKVRSLELETGHQSRDRLRWIERAFNLLAHPDLRSCYDSLLLDADAPAVFPFGGFGSVAVAGELSDDRETFFARRILSCLPDYRSRRFRAPLRRVEFLNNRAVYRDSRRKAEVFLDELVLPLSSHPTWNQWKHLVGAKFGVDGTFVKCGKYRLRNGEWHLVTWETALPSRTQINLPAEMPSTLDTARKTFTRFGQYFDFIQGLRARIEREPLEREELQRLCNQAGIPSDFDIAQISWKPDYDSFFYNQLRKRSRKLFLFRDEYVFELERAIVVEVPEQGHATYVFSRPSNLDLWVRDYSKIGRDDIRRNRNNAAERLGFIGRAMHGRNPRTWLRELRARIGEPVDYTLARH